jgi:hypothetical protein
MLTLVRTILAVIVGIAVGAVVVGVIQFVGVTLHPLPPGAENDPKIMQEHIAKLPTEAFVIVLAAWYVGTAVGAGVATWVNRFHHHGAGIVVVVFFVVAVLWQLVKIPSPGWFMAAGLLGTPVAGALGVWLFSRRREPAVEA